MNPFFLSAGILAVLLSGAHAFWGEKLIVPELKTSNLSRLTKVGFHIKIPLPISLVSLRVCPNRLL
jgi:hypothetical protein